jgi:manganese/zinc/iron transport system permease protein
MNELVPTLDFHRVFVAPWTTQLGMYGWIILMGFLVTAVCGAVGNFLILRRMSLMGDALSHSVLPGLIVAFLLANSRSTLAMFLGAVSAAVLMTVLIEGITKLSRVKADAAMGVVFSTLFAIGVILISQYARQVDLDQDCVLNGEIALLQFTPRFTLGGVTLGPVPVVRMALVGLLVAGGIVVFYRPLLVSSFDPNLAASIGVNTRAVHYALMCAVSIVVVSAFESVGAILVIGMLILPGATASFLTHSLPMRLLLSVVHAALSAVLGVHAAIWLNCSIAGAIVWAELGVGGCPGENAPDGE